MTLLTTDLTSDENIPYFMWDEPMTIAALLERLRNASAPERLRLLAKILREARDTDVWRFVSPREVDRMWELLAPKLGRRRDFWEYLLSAWREEGLLGTKQAQ
jgi:hypothetical protein